MQGAAVVEQETEPVRIRRALSPSRAADFLSCPLKYRFRTIDKLPEPADPVAARGTLVHAVLEELFGLEASARTVEHARGLVGAQWERLVREDERLAELFTDDDAAREAEWLASCEPLLDSYFALEDPRWLEPAEREIRVDHVLESGLGLGGIIDRVDVAPDGRVRVVDYKTGRAPSERFEERAMFQMRFYALVVWRSRGIVPTLLQLLYLGDRTVLSYEPTEAELLVTERKLAAVWQAVEQALETGEFRPRRSALCRWCSFQDRCPEFEGRTPDLPTFEIVPPQPLETG